MAEKIKSPEDLLALKKQAQARLDLRGEAKEIVLTVHMGTCGIAAGAREVMMQFGEELEKAGVENVTLRQSGCAGLCDREPMITLQDRGGKEYRYGTLNREKVQHIVLQHVVNGSPVMGYLIDK